ncbi:substrate-binding domain-containing protein [Streptomyces sp. NPDC090127]|uniref:substrate-binding domain-containing protein n=1 Tax=Streptomyces sp. NPDC090127 TaxID=3365953 RepID=UPI003809F91F
MTSTLRQEAILREVRRNGSVKVTDIAVHLGVSTMTVRRDIAALADRGAVTRVHGGAMLPRSRPERRTEALATHDRGRVLSIGMAVPSRGPYYRDVIDGAQAAAQAVGARLTLGVSAYGDDVPQVASMLDSKVDGLLLTPSAESLRSAAGAAWIRELPVPVVIVERRPDPAAGLDHLDRVASDHLRGTMQALRHLTDLGHLHVGLLTCPTPTAPWLAQGFDLAEGVLPLTSAAPRVTDHRYGDVEAVDAFLDRMAEVGATAAVAHPDEQAALLVERARRRGWVVPDDMAVVAYDDELAALAEIPLSAVAPARHALGRTAVSRLVRRLREGGNHVVQESLLLPRLIVRASTAG